MGLVTAKIERKLMGDLLSFGTVTVLTSFLTFIMGIYTRRIVGPELFGIWLTISLIFTYGPLTQLGTLNAMNREIPYLLAKGDLLKVVKIKRVAFTSLFGLPLLGSLGLLLFSMVSNFLLHWSKEYSLGIALSAVALFFMLISTFLEMAYKSEQDFRGVSKLTAVKSISNALFTLLFTVVWGYYGLFLGMGLSFALEIAVGKRKLRNLALEFDLGELKKLVKIGFPILIVSTLWGFATGIDRIIIAVVLTPVDLGYYGVALMTYSAIMMFPLVLGQIMYPKFPEKLGETGNYLALGPLITGVNRVAAPVMAAVVALVYVLLPPFVNHVLSDYYPGIEASRLLSLGVYPLTMVGMAANFFITIDRQKDYFLYIGIGAFLNIVLGLGLLKILGGISGVALGTAMGYGVYAFLMNRKSAQLLELSGGKYALKQFLPLVLVLGPVMIFEFMFQSYMAKIIFSMVWIFLSSGLLLNRALKYKGVGESGLFL